MNKKLITVEEYLRTEAEVGNFYVISYDGFTSVYIFIDVRYRCLKFLRQDVKDSIVLSYHPGIMTIHEQDVECIHLECSFNDKLPLEHASLMYPEEWPFSENINKGATKCYYEIRQTYNCAGASELMCIVEDEDVAKSFCLNHSGCEYIRREINV